MTQHDFDLVVYGATGFTGRQCAQWLAEHASGALRWTIAGRRREALEALAQDLGLEEPPIVADSTDPDSVDAMVAATRCVLTTAGPFSKYGTPVVEACVRHKTHYTDITGESPWVRSLIDDHHEQASADGTRIVPMCGFDSVPSDLGAWFVARQIQERFDQPTRRVMAAFAVRGGGLNGGTLASALELPQRYPLRQLADPFLLVPGKTTKEQWEAHGDPRAPVHDPERDRWMMPFFMGPVNTRVVRRSAWLFEQDSAGYGPEFGYQEYLDVKGGSKFRAWASNAAMGGAVALLTQGVGRSLAKVLGPKPGQGPSEADMDRGSFKVRYHGTAADGRTLTAEMRSPGDAGNRSTVRFVCCAALTLLDEPGPIPGQGGVLTPAYALGEPFLARLREHGVELSVTSGD